MRVTFEMKYSNAPSIRVDKYLAKCRISLLQCFGSSNMKIGIGITTFNRPDYLKQCLESLTKNIKSVDFISVYNDGSTVEYPEITKPSNVEEFHYLFNEQNHGVAHAKNALLRAMIGAGCDHLFLLEDDILLLDDKAITEYIRIGEEYGFEHFMFAHHGAANAGGSVYSDSNIDYFPACVGAWCYYTKSSLLKLKEIEEKQGLEYPGFFDENFHNAWEHVEHTKRLGDAGFTGWFGMFVDIKDSKKYISEIPGSIDNSSIRPNAGWKKNQLEGLEYWEKKWGEKAPIDLGVAP